MSKSIEVPISGMSCAACAVSVESMLKETEGIQSATVNYANQSAIITLENEGVDLSVAKKNIQSIGYDLLININNQEDLEAIKSAELSLLKRNTLYSGLLALPVFLIGMFWMNFPYANIIMWTLTTPILAVFGRSFFINSVKQGKIGNANMDTLVALSTGVAYLYSSFNTFFPHWLESRGIEPHVYFEAAAVIIFFILLGRLMESRAKAGTSEALKNLIGLQPTDLIVIRDGEPIKMNVADVQAGETILVKPGQKIPLDGILTEGQSYVDESMLTGEPIALDKNIGDNVFAGTINQAGSFKFKSNKSKSDTLLSSIIARVKQAQGSKAPIQKTVDKVTGIFVPAVLAIAVITFIIWSLSGTEDATLRGMLSAITVLVIACPCALGLATPTAIMVGIGKAASKGILIKDAESLETGKKIDTLILDKTGTITEGKPGVKEVLWKSGIDSKALASIFYALEEKSEHPLAAAVTEHFAEEKTSIDLAEFSSFTGKGVLGKYADKTYYIGNLKWLESLGINIDKTLAQTAENILDNGDIVIYLAEDNQLVGVVSIADKVRETSKVAISKLRKMGIEVHMLTGDQKKTAASIAKKVGIDHFQSGMLPQDKGEYIKKLQQKGHRVAMTGDGINDSEALVLADLGIAMGAGTDIAMETAQVTLMHSDLMAISELLKLSKETVTTIRQNLFWAFIYNIIGIPIAAGILYPISGFLLNPMIAGSAMALSSLSVVGNSLRLKYS
ncbi:heavy metal translocating P-type ATPase [Cyclobacterium amurskyense]|uniref:P-type Cu(+) transporter n=1 Tax=Cyclobacterium amurskyense TaxID=320787 RepID=A0A0H4PCZ6_9BACT|nr:heavy metal translocating P-type ATPase [Cyclobacterium amurskyense]AKP50708.1 Lead, cadmium, zinc and mercury transporting ATPase [Cyclobacterium amurskyense]